MELWKGTKSPFMSEDIFESSKEAGKESRERIERAPHTCRMFWGECVHACKHTYEDALRDFCLSLEVTS